MEPAVVNYSSDKYSVELREKERPEIGDDDVLLKVAAVGVCGSDLHQWTSDHSWPVNYPVVLGHEFSGRVAGLGKSVRGWREGDRAVSETAAIINPDSPMTRQGIYNLDPDRKGFGYGVDGAMTKYVRVPARCLHRVPESLPLVRAALTEPCCVAYSATVVNASIKPGDYILVIGPGPIGLLCAALAKLQGAIVGVAGLEKDAERLQIARAYGCVALTGDLHQWAKQGDGLGGDGVIDAAGVSATLQTAIDVVRPAGWISKVGWGPQPLNYSLDPVVQKNVTIRGSFSHNWPVWERVIRLLDKGMLDIEPLIGGEWPLSAWKEAFETMHSGKIAKAVLKP
jgi:L-iditol 2-dehydrogenase